MSVGTTRAADGPGSGIHGDDVRLSLLGGWRLVWAGRNVAEPPSVQRLVALLALRGEQSRSRIAGTLWPASSERRAGANLRATLSRLRHTGPIVARIGPAALSLDETVLVDVHELARHAHDVLHGSDDAESHRVLLTASELLPGWYDDWVIAEREQLQRLRVAALETLAEQLNQGGSRGVALDAALAAVQIDPLRERARRAAIRIHLAEGNIVEAVRMYEEFRRLLDGELGATPSRELVEMVRRFLPDA